MWKKIFLAAALSLAVASTAAAAVQEQVETGERYKLTYPVFSFENAKAAKRVNKDVKKLVQQTRKLLKNPMYREVATDYRLISETDAYVSFIFTSWNYTGGAHGMYYTEGLVYDKATGKPLPYTHFAKAVEPEQLRQDIMDGKAKVFCADLKTESKAPFLQYIKDFKVSEDYIVADDGHVYLLYQPYELDAYAAGVTYVQLA